MPCSTFIIKSSNLDQNLHQKSCRHGKRSPRQKWYHQTLHAERRAGIVELSRIYLVKLWRPHATWAPKRYRLVREIDVVHGNLGWWNIVIWPDLFFFVGCFPLDPFCIIENISPFISQHQGLARCLLVWWMFYFTLNHRVYHHSQWFCPHFLVYMRAQRCDIGQRKSRVVAAIDKSSHGWCSFNQSIGKCWSFDMLAIAPQSCSFP